MEALYESKDRKGKDQVRARDKQLARAPDGAGKSVCTFLVGS